MAAAKAKTAQEYHSDTTRLTSRMFWAPPPRNAILPGIVLSLAGGLLLAPSPRDWLVLWYASLVFGLPSLLAGVFSKALAEILGGKTYLRRTSLLALTGLTVAVGATVLVRGVEAVYSMIVAGRLDARYLSVQRIIFLAWAPAIWIRHLVMLSTSESRNTRSFPASSVQTLTAYLFAFVTLPFSVWDIVFAFLLVTFFLVSAILFAETANRPMRKSFGYDGLWLMSQFLDHMTERGEAAREKVEGFFRAISMPSRVHVGALAFKSGAGTKAVVVVPSAHPGPLGSLGGSDLPRKLSRQLADLTSAVLAPKGPSTHDQNIATLAECNRIGDKVREMLAQAKISRGGTESVIVTVGKATATAQFFGDTALMVCSLAPNPTDDIDSATGHAARQEAKSAGAADAIFVDAHNCMEVGSGLTHFGSAASHNLIEAAKEAVDAARRRPVESIKVGYASRPYTANPDDGLGPIGVQVLVVEAGGQKTAYILYDGNNMVCGLREQTIGAVRGIVDVSEVLTSDDHVVNMTMGGFNPVGMKMDRKGLVNMARELAEQAVKDLSSVECSAATGYIEDLRIFGPESAARLTTGVNLTVAMLKPALVLSLSLAVVLSILTVALVPP